MYKICGYTNYECTQGIDVQFGEYNFFETAFKVFKELSSSSDALDFEDLDEQIEEWAQDPDWEDDVYYGGYYGGSIVLFEAAERPGEWDREIFIARRQRDPKTKEVTLEAIELGEGVQPAECLLLSSNT